MALAMPAMAVLAVLAAGCGGGGSASTGSSSSAGTSQSIPIPRQKLSAWIAEFQSAASSGSCSGFRRLGLNDPCARLRRIYRGARAKDSATFQTGAVVDLDNGWTLVANEDTARRWTNSVGLQFKHPTAGTTTSDQDGAVKSAEGTFSAIVEKDCDSFYKYAYTPGIPPSQKQKVCTRAFANLGPIYSQNKDAKPVALGGTHDVQFMGYFLKVGTTRYYATVPVVFDKTSNTSPWLTLAPSPVRLGGK